MRILFVASEAMPWIKTGGLADAVAGLAGALTALGHDVRLLLPAYGDVLANFPAMKRLSGTGLYRAPAESGAASAWFCELRGISDRPGNPYHDANGRDWPDNWQRFGDFCAVATRVAGNRAGLDWTPDVVHCHDWQTGLVPVQMMLARIPAASIFTIHNLGYRGLFPPQALGALGLPSWLWHADALEFHDQLSFIKGGLVFADRLTTVSPTYSSEIRLPEHGHGLDGLLRHRGDDLSGILNGIDTRVWDPASDAALPAHYEAEDLSGKARCKARLQQELDLVPDARAPLLGLITRLVPQKGVDLVLAILPALLEQGCQLAILGSGDRELEQALAAAAAAHPGSVALRLGYDEALAHRIEAGSDLFLMPSRFEPCGLNQMYSQRYGTPPVVHATGGLVDSVIDTDPNSRRRGVASGFMFSPASAPALLSAVQRALDIYRKRRSWPRIQRAGMRRDFSWQASANTYLQVYRAAINDH